MKIFTKFVAAAILAVAALGIVSCNTATSGGPNLQEIKDKETVNGIVNSSAVPKHPKCI